VNVRFLRVAQAEYDAAMAWYRSAGPGLDQAFRSDVVTKLEQIASHPRSSPELAPDVRRAALRRFPFLLVYTIADGDIVVLAVAHMRRRPRGWRDRLADA
jgi:plasmid stabilization system protein ParE